MTGNHQFDYDEQYIEACFFAWYRAGAPGILNSNRSVSVAGGRVMKVLPTPPDGKKPNINTVNEWMQRYGWRLRADALDAEVSVRLEEQAIQERVAVLKQLAKDGKVLKDKGLKFITGSDDPFKDNPSAAVRAIGMGAEMQAKYSGQATLLENITSMTDKQVRDEILKLAGKESNENENNEIIDGSLEDVPDENTDDDS